MVVLQSLFEHGAQSTRLAHVALDREVDPLRGGTQEPAGLAEHRADRGDLQVQPLQCTQARGRIGGSNRL